MALLASMFLTAAPASAEYHDFADNGAWTTDNGDVFAIWRAGNRVFVGGDFTGVKDGVNGTPVSQPYLAAFDAITGAHIPSFDPALNGAVRTLTSSSDGTRIFAGGEFTTVDGLTRQRIVAFDALTGVVDPNFVANADNEVYDIEAWGDQLYVGGRFITVNGRFGGRAALLDANTGVRDRTWLPRPSQLVSAISIPPGGGRVYLGGTFSSLDGVSSDPMVAVDMVNGDILPGFDTNFGQRVYEIESSDDRVYIAHGDFPNYASVHTSTGAEFSRYSGDGDYQAAILQGDRAFIGSHSSRFSSFDRPGIAAVNSSDGSFSSSFDTPVFAPEGIWAIYPSGRHLWIGGDIVRINGQVWEGLARLIPAPAETIPTTPTGLTADTSVVEQIGLSWGASTDDGSIDGYRVLRAGRQIAYVSGTSFTDTSAVPGVSYEYSVEAMDDNYNASDRTTAIIATVGLSGDFENPDTATDVPAAANQVFTSTTVDLSGTATDNVGVTSVDIAIRDRDAQTWLQDDLTTWATAYNSFPSTLATPGGLATDWDAPTLTLPEGNYAVQARAFDAAGNRDGSPPYTRFSVSTVVPDTEAPDTATDVPAAANQVFTSSTVDLSGTATDNIGVTSVDIAIRDRDAQTWLQDDLTTWATAYNSFPSTLATPGGLATDWDAPTLTLSDGNYAVQARAFDAAGNRDGSPPYTRFSVSTVVPDTEAPDTVTNVPGTQNELFTSATVVLTGTATDNIGVTSVEIAIRDRVGLTWLQDDLVTWATSYNSFPSTLTAPGGIATDWTAPTLTLPDGDYAVQARAFDAAANRDQSPPYTRFRVLAS